MGKTTVKKPGSRKPRPDVTKGAESAKKAIAKAEAARAASSSRSKERHWRKPGTMSNAVWTAEFIAELAKDLNEYIDASPLPSLAEFCYLHGIYSPRIHEYKEFAELKNLLNAKRAMVLERNGLALTKAHGPRGAFLLRVMANVGDFSYREKSEAATDNDDGKMAERRQMYIDLFGERQDA